jgi:hypothetical protein
MNKLTEALLVLALGCATVLLVVGMEYVRG